MIAAAWYSGVDITTVLVAAIGVFGSLAGVYLKRRVQEIHVMVNQQKTDADRRIALLEQKLGLAAGEEIPGPQVVTKDST